MCVCVWGVYVGVQWLHITCSLPYLTEPGDTDWRPGSCCDFLFLSPNTDSHYMKAQPSFARGAEDSPSYMPCGPCEPSSQPVKYIFIWFYRHTELYICCNSTETALEWLFNSLVWLHGNQWSLCDHVFLSEWPFLSEWLYHCDEESLEKLGAAVHMVTGTVGIQ